MRAAAKSDWPWASMILAAVCLLLALLPESLVAPLSGERSALLQGELWRLWSSHITHFSLRHALLDSVTLLVIGTLAESTFGSRHTALALLVGAPLISAAMLLASPALLDYRGASAIAVMLATAAGLSLWRSQPASRPILGALAICLLAKIAFDAIGLSVTLTDLPDQVRVAWQAHLFGGVLGTLWYFANARARSVSADRADGCNPARRPGSLCRPS